MASYDARIRKPQKLHLILWFGAGGILGLVVCFAILAYGLDLVPNPVLHRIWPTFVGVFDPSESWGKVETMVGLFSFGGQFLVYGIGGLAVGLVLSFGRPHLKHR